MPEGHGPQAHKAPSQSHQDSLPSTDQPKQKTLEYWLTRATDPYLADSSRPEFVKGFCDQVNEELEGPQIACRLLAHKIQSPYEVEALHGLNALESCVKNCGNRFHNEIGKFRFLNEIIKILSPKYMGAQTNERVKQKAIEMLYWWKQSMRHLQKVQQAYEMLKEQGIITQDPVYMDEILEIQPMPSEKPRLASFEDEEKSKLLAALLKSNNPDDLQTANRLIKSMVKAEDQKVEKISKRSEDLQTARNNAQLLQEMVTQFHFTSSNTQDVEIMKELADSIQKLRPTLFRYAGEAAEGQEETLGEVLTTNDEVSKAVDEYRARVEPHVADVLARNPPVSSSSTANDQIKNSVLLSSLLSFDSVGPSGSGKPDSLITPDLPSSSSELSITSDDVGLLSGAITPMMLRKKAAGDGVGNSAGGGAVHELNELFGSTLPERPNLGNLNSQQTAGGMGNLNQQIQSSSSSEVKSPVAGTAARMQEEEKKQKKGLFDLDALSEALIKQNLPTDTFTMSDAQKMAAQRQKVPMRDLPKQQTGPPSMSPLDPYAHSLPALELASAEGESGDTSGPASPSRGVLVDIQQGEDPVPNSPRETPVPVEDVIVPVESIEPGERDPVGILKREQVKVVLHYAANRPKPGILTTVVSVTTTSPQPLVEVKFQARTDRKDFNVKLEKASSDKLPAYNPIFPQSAISQIMLVGVAKPNDTIRIPLDYTLTYSVGQDAKSSHSVSGSFDVEYLAENE